MPNEKLPLLLVDNQNVMSILNEGDFRCSGLNFEEAKDIIEMHPKDFVLRCFSGHDLEDVVFNYLKIDHSQFEYKKVSNMRVGQDAIAFKLYVTPSETQPIVQTPMGTDAKKIQNVYVYCQYISRIK
ncbi:MAG: hypothetical protein RR177_03335 [Oscillospiraceae bacterium]